ncbi:MAG: PH domain-containing protein [Candidatus Komeilibacteria bacterium]|nr:PH domain-containing protein [Candidatus Komeilibacteria bacterium]
MPYFTRILKEKEELERLIRFSPAVFFKPAAAALFFFLLPFFLMFLLFRWELYGLILFFILLIIGLWLLVRLIVMWHYNVFLITNQRLILYRQKGLFDRRVSETDYEKIQDVSWRIKGFWQTVLRYGSVRLQLIGSESPIIVSKIPKPQQVQQLLLSIKKNRPAA